MPPPHVDHKRQWERGRHERGRGRLASSCSWFRSNADLLFYNKHMQMCVCIVCLWYVLLYVYVYWHRRSTFQTSFPGIFALMWEQEKEGEDEARHCLLEWSIVQTTHTHHNTHTHSCHATRLKRAGVESQLPYTAYACYLINLFPPRSALCTTKASRLPSCLPTNLSVNQRRRMRTRGCEWEEEELIIDGIQIGGN